MSKIKTKLYELRKHDKNIYHTNDIQHSNQTLEKAPLKSEKMKGFLQ